MDIADLIQWMQNEVVTRLQVLDQRMEMLSPQLHTSDAHLIGLPLRTRRKSVGTGRSAAADMHREDNAMGPILMCPPLHCGGAFPGASQSMWRASLSNTSKVDHKEALLGDQPQQTSDQEQMLLAQAKLRFADSARIDLVDTRTGETPSQPRPEGDGEPLVSPHTERSVEPKESKELLNSQGAVETDSSPPPSARGDAEKTKSRDECEVEEDCTESYEAEDVRQYPRRSSEASAIIDERLQRRSVYRDKVWQFLDDMDSSPAARAYGKIMPVITMLSILVTLAQGFEPAWITGVGPAVAETSVETLFTLDLVLRFMVCPEFYTFVTDHHNIVDLFAACPLGLRAYSGFMLQETGVARDFLLYIVPILRSLKMLRRFERFTLIVAAAEHSFEALPILLFSLMVITLTFSSAIFLVEPRDNIQSLQQAMWLTIVTMTTVGYGDTTPISAGGSIIVACLVVSSVLYMAMPLGIIGHAFTTVWEDRDRILLTRRVATLLTQWGYQAEDIPTIFHHYDANADGELSLEEFIGMMQDMRIGLKEKRMIQLYDVFDQDGSGGIDASEFVKAIFGVEPESLETVLRQREFKDLPPTPKVGGH